MEIPEQQIEYAVNPKTPRDELKHVSLDKEKGILIATDGHILGCVPIDPLSLTSDSSGLIPIPAMKEARKNKHFRMKVNGDVQLQDGKRYQKPHTSYPDIDNTLDGNILTRWVEPTIVFDPEKLYRLWKSIKTKESTGICLWIRKDKFKAIYVQCADDSNAFGILMPMHSDPSNMPHRIKAHSKK